VEVCPGGVGVAMNEKQRELVRKILEINRDFAVIPDHERGFRREGEKNRVYAELRVFNGQPQLVVFYGKVRYTWNIVPRDEPNPMKALKRITGYKGIQSIPPELLKEVGLGNDALALWAEMLRERGV